MTKPETKARSHSHCFRRLATDGVCTVDARRALLAATRVGLDGLKVGFRVQGVRRVEAGINANIILKAIPFFANFTGNLGPECRQLLRPTVLLMPR